MSESSQKKNGRMRRRQLERGQPVQLAQHPAILGPVLAEPDT
jgi:hypothetical protein